MTQGVVGGEGRGVAGGGGGVAGGGRGFYCRFLIFLTGFPILFPRKCWTETKLLIRMAHYKDSHFLYILQRTRTRMVR